MSCGASSDQHWAGEPRLERDAAKATFSSEASAAGFLLVEVGPPRPAARGRLALCIEGAIERALEARGAPSPGSSGQGDRESSLGDHLERAHISGAAGIALWLSPLEGIANTSGVLDCDDSAIIRWWVRAASEKAVTLGFDATNQRLGVYLEPRTLESLLAETSRAEIADDDASEASANDGSLTPRDDADASDSESDDDGNEDPPPSSAPDAGFADSARAMAAELSADGENGWLREALIELSTPPPLAVIAEASGDSTGPEADAYDESLPPPPIAPRLSLAFAEPTLAPAPPRFELDADARRKLDACARDLASANGPKPLAVVERLFTNSYVPLRTALDRGADVPGLRKTADEWARSFANSYTEGFDALRVRTKRPAMVVDVPDIALRVARLHGARTTQLLLVDAMRFDLGDAVNERLRTLVGQRAACAERFLLWSALPTTTGTQVELIGRGPAGLREIGEGVSEDLVVAHGRKASMIRRLKTGHRDVLKLDVVAARITETGGGDPAGFDVVIDEVAQRIAAHFESLQPRTLVLVFGDHGFAIESRGDGPAGARQGGASPEEVLVPAFAWLVGAVH